MQFLSPFSAADLILLDFSVHIRTRLEREPVQGARLDWREFIPQKVQVRSSHVKARRRTSKVTSTRQFRSRGLTTTISS